MAKTYNKKKDFIELLASMTDTQLNDYIKTHGKRPKPVVMCTIVKERKENNDEEGVCSRGQSNI